MIFFMYSTKLYTYFFLSDFVAPAPVPTLALPLSPEPASHPLPAPTPCSCSFSLPSKGINQPANQPSASSPDNRSQGSDIILDIMTAYKTCYVSFSVNTYSLSIQTWHSQCCFSSKFLEENNINNQFIDFLQNL